MPQGQTAGNGADHAQAEDRQQEQAAQGVQPQVARAHGQPHGQAHGKDGAPRPDSHGVKPCKAGGDGPVWAHQVGRAANGPGRTAHGQQGAEGCGGHKNAESQNEKKHVACA